MALVLLGELIFVLTNQTPHATEITIIEPKQVGAALFGAYLIGTELAGFLLLAGLVGAFHIGRQDRPKEAVAP